MPIYEYQCDDCEHELEVLQKISDEPLKACPECGNGSLRKLVSAAAFRLSGSGWYETDFKDKKMQKNLSKSDDKPATDAGSKKPDVADSKKSEGDSAEKGKTSKPAEKSASSTTSSE